MELNEKTKELRRSGLDILRYMRWGTHFCAFFDTKQDLLDMVVPYFKVGLEDNEFCLWVICEPLNLEEGKESLRQVTPDLDERIAKHQIEILTHQEWYLFQGQFDPDRIINSWYEKLNQALARGYSGMRVYGNEAWLNKGLWNDFLDYEGVLNNTIKGHKMLCLCVYPLTKRSAADLFDVVRVHEFAVTKRKGDWEVLEARELKETKAEIKKLNTELELRISERTSQLAIANQELRKEIEGHLHTEETLQKSEANLRTIFENTEIGFVLLDRNFNILCVNTVSDIWTKFFFGGALKEGINLISEVREDRKKESLEMLFKVRNGSSLDFETDYSNLQGSPEWYRVKMNPVKDIGGAVLGIFISAENITSLKEAEIERGKVTQELIQRNKDLEQFAYIISHNLRSPVANIIGISEELKDESHKEDVKNLLRNELVTAVSRLDEIIRDLNQILQVRREINEKKQVVNFSQLVSDIQATIKNLVQKENVQILTSFQEADQFKTVKSYLYSIFYNLIINSVKYRQPGEPPLIEIRSEKKDGKLSLTFKDNGMGIDLNRNAEHVFGLYKRFHPEIEGKGMGLYMVKSQVETLGGSISIKSIPNVGTEFLIEFEV